MGPGSCGRGLRESTVEHLVAETLFVTSGPFDRKDSQAMAEGAVAARARGLFLLAFEISRSEISGRGAI